MEELDLNGQDVVFLGSDDDLFRDLSVLASSAGLCLRRTANRSALIGQGRGSGAAAILVAAHEAASLNQEIVRDPDGLPLVITLTNGSGGPTDKELAAEDIFDVVDLPLDRRRAILTLRRLAQGLRQVASQRSLNGRLKSYHNQWMKLNQIGTALSTIHDLSQLLDFILRKCREITSADSGSLYLKEYSSGDGTIPKGQPILRFKVAQNDSKFIPFKEWTMPAHKQSISGYVAIEGEVVSIDDVYRLPSDAPFRFDSSFDRTSGYRTRSMLVVPMRNHKDEIIGVIQLINKKRQGTDALKTPQDAEDHVIPFARDDRELARSLASQAGVTIENARLVEDLRVAMHQLKGTNAELQVAKNKIEVLFEGFVNTCARAVEARDNALSGHIERMALYAINVAKALNAVREGPLAVHKFDETQLKAIKFGAILHDMGKIGVKEETLWKATRLKPDRLEAVRYRFRAIEGRLRDHASRRQIKYILDNPRSTPASEYFVEVEHELSDTLKGLEIDLTLIERINKMGFLSDEDLATLNVLREKRVPIGDDEVELITEDEYENLSVRKGNLTAREWVEMKKHVKFTYEILAEIPWEGDLRWVPEIAGSHHEKRDGTGYHRGLKGDEIHIGGQIVAMCDIFEALTASDRPYKKQFTRDEALAFLEECGRTNWLNADLVKLFIGKRLWEIELPDRLRQPQATAPADRPAAPAVAAAPSGAGRA